MSNITLWVAGLMGCFLLFLALYFSKPILFIFLIIWSGICAMLGYRWMGEKEALQRGQRIEAQWMEVRHWRRPMADGKFRDSYGIIAQWTNPATGKVHHFSSSPLQHKPKKDRENITVWVVPDKPERYRMDLDFLKDQR